jgi:hypothetical protein
VVNLEIAEAEAFHSIQDDIKEKIILYRPVGVGLWTALETEPQGLPDPSSKSVYLRTGKFGDGKSI